MKKLTLLTLLTSLSAFPGVAQEAAAPATAAATAPAKVKKPAVTNSTAEAVTGKIGYISDKKITVKAKGAEASTAFLVDAETKVTVNGEAKAIADLKKGWSASVAPKATDFTTAAKIEVTKAASPADAAATPAVAPAKTEE
jgi:hypothetical protein